MTFFAVQHAGRPATATELAPLAFAGYAHFTAMQVRAGEVRGIDLHLDRLRTASEVLFGRALPDERVLSRLRSALAVSPPDVSLTAAVSSSAGEFVVADRDCELELLVRTGPPASGPAGPLRLTTVEYERVLPEVKHVGEVAKTYFLRQAVERGFDDAAFVDRRGRLSEGTIWNLAFLDGSEVVWPQADMLTGTTMNIVRRQLDRLGVAQRFQEITSTDLPALSGAVVMNSWTPGVAVEQIDEIGFSDNSTLLELLHRAFQVEPLAAP
ncbi:aminotransferase class IV family protein [Actinoalloteichus hymeniacidonis]|uniref:Branched-chain amino acid aminotransferase/4-amino-4-deoxychorismate lyase n=1 Tax=Actinoalloteichus hymeniacidonis TaxID=340345 RepID=A0AAC9HR51_9PSEU|nr:aminotransferase class IV family protein [Actinoalloteichus hymeniacidonis]AOS63910.1 branched-chain amino acid aminotransferase/4-amino-4-deoxychorismate lyase [Actinoalloteichus hymeniacidonis]MBB5908034.1 branched-subunit amino acid aminotransferase/4-amino-4-deoxychorismate lyase [Actinoalloteichus hymeniacidonis]